MIKNVCTEIAEFQVLPEIKEERFVEIVEDLEMKFHLKQSGLIHTELVKGNEQCQWIMIQHWESIEAARESSKRMMKEPVTEDFRQALDVKNIKIRYLTQVKTWNR